MSDNTIISAMESVLFVAGDGVPVAELAAALEIEQERLERIVDEEIERRRENESGILLTRVDDKVQLCSNAQYTPLIEKVLQPVKKSRLSQSLIETLAIIAYKQPITRYEIEQIRGVKSNYSVATLIEKGLITRAGRKKTLGNPVLYVTSEEFLRHFQLRSLDELPPLKEAE